MTKQRSLPTVAGKKNCTCVLSLSLSVFLSLSLSLSLSLPPLPHTPKLISASQMSAFFSSSARRPRKSNRHTPSHHSQASPPPPPPPLPPSLCPCKATPPAQQALPKTGFVEEEEEKEGEGEIGKRILLPEDGLGPSSLPPPPVSDTHAHFISPACLKHCLSHRTPQRFSSPPPTIL